jgi:hypothetical protein
MPEPVNAFGQGYEAWVHEAWMRYYLTHAGSKAKPNGDRLKAGSDT